MTVTLRPLAAADLPWFFQLQCDPESNRMAMTHPRSQESFDQAISQTLGDPDVHSFIVLADDERVGVMSAFPRDGGTHVGYWIARGWWGRGIATQALAQLIERVSTRPLTAIAATSNVASLRVLAKCGFRIDHCVHMPETERYLACEEAVHLLDAGRS